MTYTIAQPCVDVKDKACIEECPVDCIYDGARMLFNAEFFEELGSPGGAAKVGMTENDPQAVKDLPPQGEGD